MGVMSGQSVGTDALNALAAISGVDNVELVRESEEQAELSYTWHGDEKFWERDEHLAKFGLVYVRGKQEG